MAKAKKVLTYASPAIDNFINDEWIISNVDIGAANVPGVDDAGNAYDGTKHAIGMKKIPVAEFVPEDVLANLDKYIKEQLGDEADTQTMLNIALTGLLTRPQWKEHVNSLIEAGSIAEGDWPAAQKACQELADNYQIGRKKAAGANQKAQVAELNSLKGQAAALGLSMEDLMAAAAKLKAQE